LTPTLADAANGEIGDGHVRVQRKDHPDADVRQVDVADVLLAVGFPVGQNPVALHILVIIVPAVG